MEKYKSASYGDDAAHSAWYKKDCCSWKRGVQVCYNCWETSTYCFVWVLSSDFFNYQHHKDSLNHLTLSCTQHNLLMLHKYVGTKKNLFAKRGRIFCLKKGQSVTTLEHYCKAIVLKVVSRCPFGINTSWRYGIATIAFSKSPYCWTFCKISLAPPSHTDEHTSSWTGP